MEIHKLTNHIGAEVLGIDLTQPVDINTRQVLNRALSENLVLVFRNQALSRPQFRDAVLLLAKPNINFFNNICTKTHPK